VNTGETFFVRLRLVLFEFGGGTARLLDLDDLGEPLRSVTKKQRREARRKLEAEEVRRSGQLHLGSDRRLRDACLRSVLRGCAGSRKSSDQEGQGK
jgi:hypothetical protein